MYPVAEKMNAAKDEMEEGEVSSSDGEDLGEYTPLQVCKMQALLIHYLAFMTITFCLIAECITNFFPSAEAHQSKASFTAPCTYAR